MTENSIVGYVTNIDPPIQLGPSHSPPKRLPASTKVAFSNGSTANLDSSEPAAVAFAFALEFSRTRRRVLEVALSSPSVSSTDGGEPARKVKSITGVDLPSQGVVTEVSASNRYGEGINVQLDSGNTIFNLLNDNKEFNELLDALNIAKESGKPILLATKDGTACIREILEPTESPGVPGGTGLFPLHWPVWLCGGSSTQQPTAVSDSDAQILFDKLGSCDPFYPMVDCIPFLFPDKGCEARAHEACRLLRKGKVMPGKLWAFKDIFLEPYTQNYPPADSCTHPPCECFVGWSHHVAPYLLSQERPNEKIVMDPSLFDTPVSEAIWMARFRDAHATSDTSHHSIYFRDLSGSNTQKDSLYIKSHNVLSEIRVRLCLRAHTIGAPPYTKCAAP